MSTYYHVMAEAPATSQTLPVVIQFGVREVSFPIETRVGDQVHTLVEEVPDLDAPRLLYCAGWNQINPYIDLLKTTPTNPINLAYSGWPNGLEVIPI